MKYSSAANAQAFLEKLVAEKRGDNRYRLPPAKQLAREAGVAESTLLKAVRALRDRGLLEVSHGKGIRIAPDVSPQPPKTGSEAMADLPRWRLVATMLYQRIISGQWERIPSLKELRDLLGASYPTLKQALNQLVNDGILTVHKRSYRVAPVAPPAHGNTVVFVSRGIHLSNISIDNILNLEIIPTLQSLCNQLNLRLKPVPYYYQGESVCGLENLRLTAKNDYVLGYIICAEGIEYSYLVDTLRFLHDLNRPVAIFNRGEWVDFSSIVQPRLTRFFAPSLGPSPGKAIARYLLSLGHQRVAYIEENKENEWSFARFQGIRDEFQLAGFPNAVTHLRSPKVDPPESSITQYCHAVSDLTEGLFKELTLPRHLDTLTVYHPPIVLSQIHHLQQRIQLHAAVESCIDTVLSTPDISCIIGANDRVALACLSLLYARNIAVPGRLSVIGADNTFESFVCGLTSYDFSLAELTRHMLFFVLYPNRERYYVGKSILVNHQGAIVPRTTTGHSQSGAPPT